MFLLWRIFLMVSRKQAKKKKKRKKFNLCGFSMFGNTHYFWSHYELESLYCSRMHPCPCKLISAAYPPSFSPILKIMTPVRDVHSFSPFIHFSPAWQQHHKCLKGTLISSEGFISKQLFQKKAPFHFKKYLNYKTTDERGHFRSTSDELSWVSTEEVHLKW